MRERHLTNDVHHLKLTDFSRWTMIRRVKRKWQIENDQCWLKKKISTYQGWCLFTVIWFKIADPFWYHFTINKGLFMLLWLTLDNIHRYTFDRFCTRGLFSRYTSCTQIRPYFYINGSQWRSCTVFLTVTNFDHLIDRLWSSGGVVMEKKKGKKGKKKWCTASSEHSMPHCAAVFSCHDSSGHLSLPVWLPHGPLYTSLRLNRSQHMYNHCFPSNHFFTSCHQKWTSSEKLEHVHSLIWYQKKF